MPKPPVTLAQLRDMLVELREDRAVESEAIASILHNQDEQTRCLGVILRMVKHLHGRAVSPKRRAAVRTNR